MQTEYKYIKFYRRNLDTWYCRNKEGTLLGLVIFEQGWKQYVFTPMLEELIFSATCLDDISHFLKQLNGTAKDDLASIARRMLRR